MASNVHDNDDENVKQPSGDPEMPIPTPPDARSSAAGDADASPEVKDARIEDRFEATDN